MCANANPKLTILCRELTKSLSLVCVTPCLHLNLALRFHQPFTDFDTTGATSWQESGGDAATGWDGGAAATGANDTFVSGDARNYSGGFDDNTTGADAGGEGGGDNTCRRCHQGKS